jgi:hypothetical protein
MKTVLFVSVCLALHGVISAKEKIDWSVPAGNIESAFPCKHSAKQTEFIRIYSSGIYEHLLFDVKAEGKEYVKRNLGKFVRRGKKITFLTPYYKQFSGEFKYGIFYHKMGLYRSKWDAILERTTRRAFVENNSPAYHKPFFIGMKCNVIVFNKEAKDELEFHELVAYLVAGKETDSAMVASFEHFIARSISYDHVGYDTEITVNDQFDVRSILAGPNRKALCEGYSNCLRQLCYSAGIEIFEIPGWTRPSVAELSRLGGYHVWNKIYVDGNYELHDLTWADNGDYAHGSWLNTAPEVMVLSHFPDRIEEQLLETPISQIDFLTTACVYPFVEGVTLKHSPLPSYIYTKDAVQFTVHSDAQVALFRMNPDVLFEPGTKEPKGTRTAQIIFPESNYRKEVKGDSTTYVIQLTSFLTVFQIEIDESYEILFAAVKGTYSDLLSFYAQQANQEQYEKFVKGVLSAIKLKDYELLKNLAGERSVFFDKKGRFALNKEPLALIEAWDGTYSQLFELKNTTFEPKDTAKPTEWKSYLVEIPNGVKFTLNKVDGRYTVAKLE